MMKLGIKNFIIFGLALLLLLSRIAMAQSLTGAVTDANNVLLKDVEIKVSGRDSARFKITTDNAGKFSVRLHPGEYHFSINAAGFAAYRDSFTMHNADVHMGLIRLSPLYHQLDEIKIVSKVLAIVQKDDTVEFNSGAYKMNPDADGADLVRKMPSIEINGKQLKAQGETVVKVLVDGKPFFGSDPYGSLKTIPAEIIDKVQVYNEKSDQEQFTGFSEGNTSKTINIITKPDKRVGVFGKVYGGGGEDNTKDDKYGAGANLNRFDGDRRLTFTGQTNNINDQNFSSDNITTGSNNGITTTNAAGINYADKWGRKADVSGSYSFSQTSNKVENQFQRNYTLSADSGQVYNETSPSANHGYNHRMNFRLNYVIDSMNSLLWQPAFYLNHNNNNVLQTGNTEQAQAPLNSTVNNNITDRTLYNVSGSLLFRHLFHRKRRTFSANLNISGNNNQGTILHTARNIYYTNFLLNDTIDQQTLQRENVYNLAANLTYTEPAGKRGLLKAEYSVAYIHSRSSKNTDNYSYATDSYSIPDILLSNVFNNDNISHKAGGSYLYHWEKAEMSAGVNYQYTEFENRQQLPAASGFDRGFQNILPAAMFRYKFSRQDNVQVIYNTNTQVPAIGQLQDVVNNIDPLHLYTGNPLLRQPYRHNLTIRYTAMSRNAKNNLSVVITGSTIAHGIATNSIIAQSDTTIMQSIVLPKGSQLTMPVNISGYNALNGNISYGMPLDFFKCRLNLSADAGITKVPSLINSVLNFQENKTVSTTISLNSNISERIDFSIASTTSFTSSSNLINPQLNTQYVYQNGQASLNLIIWRGIVFNTVFSYQVNSGLSAGYNENYLLWNASLGKKIFKKHQGDIRLSAVNLLDQDNSVQHIITDTYVQDIRTNTLQRYFLLTFTYKIREFGK